MSDLDIDELSRQLDGLWSAAVPTHKVRDLLQRVRDLEAANKRIKEPLLKALREIKRVTTTPLWGWQAEQAHNEATGALAADSEGK